MKLSIFTTLSDPGRRQDPYKEALYCYLELADELVVIDGSQFAHSVTRNILLGTKKETAYIHSIWPTEFSWDFIGKQFQKGYDACSGDWVIHMDLDYFFHER